MDFVNLNYPRVSLIKSALARGHLPLWNWNEWGGAPLLAALQGAALYPGTWLAMLLPLPYGLQVFVWLHLLGAACGAYKVARMVCGLPVPLGVLCGIVYMGNSFFPGRLEQFQIIATNTLLPWLVLAMWRFSGSVRSVIALATTWLLTVLAGHPQYAAFNFIGAVAICGVAAVFSKTTWPFKRLACAAGALALGTLGAAGQLLPTWELSRLSERIWPYADPTTPELSWLHLPALVVPRYFNQLTGQYGRVFGFTELGLYAGLLAVPLALLGMLRLGKGGAKDRPVVAALAVVWCVTMVFALGKHGLIASVVYDYFPFFKNSRGAARSLNVSALALALLVGLGAAQLAAWKPPLRRVGWMLCVLFCADLALVHYPALRSILVPVQALAPRPLLAEGVFKDLIPAGRVYRFMSKDSDLYLNNSAAAVAERAIRLQPNSPSANAVAVTDGYEEGLLPTRHHANLFRKYNRNFRADSPDPALLAFLGSNVMLSEFPLPAGTDWTALHRPWTRPSVVPPVMVGADASYQYYSSAYRVDSIVFNLDKLVAPDKRAGFLQDCARDFPLSNPERLNPGTEPVRTALSQVSAESFKEAQQGFVNDQTKVSWNGISIKSDQPVAIIGVLMSQYPGWKVLKNNQPPIPLKSLCSFISVVELTQDVKTTDPFSVVFAPYSVRLGNFFSLLAILVFTLLLGNRFLQRINFVKEDT